MGGQSSTAQRPRPQRGFLRRSLDETLERREACCRETVARYMNPGRVVGVITRSDFSRRIAERFLEGPS